MAQLPLALIAYVSAIFYLISARRGPARGDQVLAVVVIAVGSLMLLMSGCNWMNS
jgi:hypothetical protein